VETGKEGGGVMSSGELLKGGSSIIGGGTEMTSGEVEGGVLE
jgi:hypothetical protein